MRRLTDGEREVLAELERDARDTEAGLWPADDAGPAVDHATFDALLHAELDAAEIAAAWTHVGDDDGDDDNPPW